MRTKDDIRLNKIHEDDITLEYLENSSDYFWPHGDGYWGECHCVFAFFEMYRDNENNDFWGMTLVELQKELFRRTLPIDVPDSYYDNWNDCTYEELCRREITG